MSVLSQLSNAVGLNTHGDFVGVELDILDNTIPTRPAYMYPSESVSALLIPEALRGWQPTRHLVSLAIPNSNLTHRLITHFSFPPQACFVHLTGILRSYNLVVGISHIRHKENGHK